jgi:hypothetical protein
MKDFETTLFMNQTAWQASFSEIISKDGNRFFVQLKKENRPPVQYLELKKDQKGVWHLVHPAPDWVYPLQSRLIAAILSHQK